MKIIDYKKLDNKTILFTFDDRKQRTFCIDRMLQDDVPKGQQYRWKSMFDKGLFFTNLYISQGEPVWKGWTELIDDEVITYTESYEDGGLQNVNI